MNPLFQMQLSGGRSAEEKKASREDWKRQSSANRKLKFSYQEQKDYETIEEEIAGLEEKIEQLELEMQKNATDFGKLSELTAQKEETAAKLEERMNRWMYLEELAEQIARSNSEMG